MADFWRGDLLDGFASGVHALPTSSEPAPADEEESCLAALAGTVEKLVAARRSLGEEFVGRRLSIAEVEEGLHLVEIALEHLRHLGPALERHGSAQIGEEEKVVCLCDRCGRSGGSGVRYRCCSHCKSFLCERCMIDDLCLDCHRRRDEEGRTDAINRSEEFADFAGSLTEDEAASLRDRLRQRTRQQEYRPGDGKRRPTGAGG